MKKIIPGVIALILSFIVLLLCAYYNNKIAFFIAVLTVCLTTLCLGCQIYKLPPRSKKRKFHMTTTTTINVIIFNFYISLLNAFLSFVLALNAFFKVGAVAGFVCVAVSVFWMFAARLHLSAYRIRVTKYKK